LRGMVCKFCSRNRVDHYNLRKTKMAKTEEFQNVVRWARSAHLSSLINAMVGTCRYPAVIRDELRARLKASGEESFCDLVRTLFQKEHEPKRDVPEPETASKAPGAFLVQLRDHQEFWRWAWSANTFSRGAERMWKKCFDDRLTAWPTEKLTDGELRLIEAFENALRDYKVEKEHDFQAFLNDNE
jgi:hypothetical protein